MVEGSMATVNAPVDTRIIAVCHMCWGMKFAHLSHIRMDESLSRVDKSRHRNMLVNGGKQQLHSGFIINVAGAHPE